MDENIINSLVHLSINEFISVLTSLVPLLIPLPIMVLGIFAGSVQALIFSTLAGAYIAEALE